MEVDSLDPHPVVHPFDLVPLPNEYDPQEDDIDPALRELSEVLEPKEERNIALPAKPTQDHNHAQAGVDEPVEAQYGDLGALEDEEAMVGGVNDGGEGDGGDPGATEDEVDGFGGHEDPALKEILASLRASSHAVDADEFPDQENENEEVEVQQRELSSPLSSVPDLPTELSLPAEPEPVQPTAPISHPRPSFFVDVRKPTLSNGSGISPNAEAGPSRSPTHVPSGAAPVEGDTAKESIPHTKSPKTQKSPLVDLTPAKRKRTKGQTLNYALEQVSDGELEVRPKTKVKRKARPKKERDESEDSDLKVGKRKRGVGEAYKGGKSRKMLDHVLGMDRDSGEHGEKIAPRAKVYNETQIREMLQGKETETQISVCLRERYAKWGKCTQCIGKQGGDTCRFRDFRTFKIDPETTEILEPGYFESTEWKDTMTPLPKVFNTPMKQEHVERIERTVAPLLLPLISRELRHLVHNKAIKRGMDAARHRAVCDFCASTIFAGWWFCKRCGRDICLVCERYFSDSLQTMSQSPWHLPDAARPRLLKCNAHSGTNKPQFHFRPDLQPVSRFSEDELQAHWLALAEFVLEGEGNGGVGERLNALGLGKAGEDAVEAVQEWTTLRHASTQVPVEAALSDEEIQALYTKSTQPTVEHPADPAGLENESMAFTKIDDDKLTNPVFDLLWSRGEPIVVDKIGDKLKMSWTPDAFVERFGPQKAIVVDCQTDKKMLMTIQRYFSAFNDRENRSDKILKLKDWPTTDDFADAVPELYNDFCDALPVPDLTRREGVLNLYANFPPGPTRPDIGPKMYNAFEAREDVDGKGSTSLHMDVADAINVMLYASPRSDGQPGCAVWDLFRAQDADKIRSFLKTKFDTSHVFTDPIHSQLFYLHSGLRKQLWEEYRVASWRIYQYPGQAVFIPAGCAHQVCNLADCIKIAVDFVSPHNVGRCQQLTQDFRTENFVKSWKEDVLQLYNVLWYAWTNTREIKDRWAADARSEAQTKEERARHLAALANGEHPPEQDSHPGVQRSLSGFLGHQISSARDEGIAAATDMDTAVKSGPDTGGIDGAEAEQPASTSTAPPHPNQDKPTPLPPPDPAQPLEDSDPSINTPSILVPSGPAIQPLSNPLDARRRAIARKLMAATLSLAEPPPPPEARNPSAATNWVIGAGGRVAQPVKVKRKATSGKKKKSPLKESTESGIGEVTPNKSTDGGAGIAIQPELKLEDGEFARVAWAGALEVSSGDVEMDTADDPTALSDTAAEVGLPIDTEEATADRRDISAHGDVPMDGVDHSGVTETTASEDHGSTIAPIDTLISADVTDSGNI